MTNNRKGIGVDFESEEFKQLMKYVEAMFPFDGSKTREQKVAGLYQELYRIDSEIEKLANRRKDVVEELFKIEGKKMTKDSIKEILDCGVENE